MPRRMNATKQARASDERALIALGANLPHGALAGAALLGAAVDELRRRGLALIAVSSAWESPAWPPSDQPNFVNAVAAFGLAGHTPRQLLEELLAVERAFGRERRARWAARTLDLDLIDVNGLVFEEPGLTLPHPRAHERAFVLAPLLEVEPRWRHPATGQTGVSLFEMLSEKEIWRLGPVSLRDCENGP